VRTTNKKCVICALKEIYVDTMPSLFRSFGFFYNFPTMVGYSTFPFLLVTFFLSSLISLHFMFMCWKRHLGTPNWFIQWYTYIMFLKV